jgi:GT2 family glycosyltransferase
MIEKQVDLFCLGAPPPGFKWNLGKIWMCEPTPRSVSSVVLSAMEKNTPEALLFWDVSLGEIPLETVSRFLQSPDDIWHGGLQLGMAGLPEMMKYVAPAWMLNCDAPSVVSSSSWRISLRACLVRSEVVRQLGFVDKEFFSLAGASLEWGHHCLMKGAVTRFVPDLLPHKRIGESMQIPLKDEIRFVWACYKPFWAKWSLFLSVLQRPQLLFHISSLLQFIRKIVKESLSGIFQKKENISYSNEPIVNISVILPTLERYEFLEKCLMTIRAQTIKPLEVLCIDQNLPEKRRPDIYEKFNDMPIQVYWQDEKGQSLARNTALEKSSGEWIFFADDDSEYSADTLHQHIELALSHNADASTGLSLPPFPYSIPLEYQHARIAYNLDTGNALIRKSAILHVGGFDLNYDFGKGTDTDLGMRLYLSGFLLLHNPNARRLHYKAEVGGLRTYGVKWETRDISINQPRPVATYTYWIMRYFPKKIWAWAVFHSVIFGNLPFGSTKNMRGLFSHYLREALLMPVTLYQIHCSFQKAKSYLLNGPRLLRIQKT